MSVISLVLSLNLSIAAFLSAVVLTVEIDMAARLLICVLTSSIALIVVAF